MTATERLRRMLDERGVEYLRHEDGEPLRELKEAGEPATSWLVGDVSVCAIPNKGDELVDLFDLWIGNCAPEHAIAATVGETCRMTPLSDEPTTSIQPMRCTACGHKTYAQLANYCPHCGAKVVD